MSIEIKICKKHVYIFSIIAILLLGGILVTAFQSGGPPGFVGHSAEELNITGLESQLSCSAITGSPGLCDSSDAIGGVTCSAVSPTCGDNGGAPSNFCSIPFPSSCMSKPCVVYFRNVGTGAQVPASMTLHPAHTGSLPNAFWVARGHSLNTISTTGTFQMSSGTNGDSVMSFIANATSTNGDFCALWDDRSGTETSTSALTAEAQGTGPVCQYVFCTST